MTRARPATRQRELAVVSASASACSRMSEAAACVGGGPRTGQRTRRARGAAQGGVLGGLERRRGVLEASARCRRPPRFAGHSSRVAQLAEDVGAALARGWLLERPRSGERGAVRAPPRAPRPPAATRSVSTASGRRRVGGVAGAARRRAAGRPRRAAPRGRRVHAGRPPACGRSGRSRCGRSGGRSRGRARLEEVDPAQLVRRPPASCWSSAATAAASCRRASGPRTAIARASARGGVGQVAQAEEVAGHGLGTQLGDPVGRRAARVQAVGGHGVGELAERKGLPAVAPWQAATNGGRRRRRAACAAARPRRRAQRGRLTSSAMGSERRLVITGGPSPPRRSAR